MLAAVQITIGGEVAAFDLDFKAKRWSTKRALPESYFPLVAGVGDKRYELYSDGTFAEVEL
jgi:hypothetical protein